MKSPDNIKRTQIPSEVIENLENEIDGINHGSIKLEITLRDKKFMRFVIIKETSILASDLAEGGQK